MSRDIPVKAQVHLEVTPLEALVDEQVAIRLSGLLPGQTATLWMRTRDGQEDVWVSSASFVADDHGEIDLTTQQPVAGSYHKVDPMGLFWSMQPVEKKQPIFLLTGDAKPVAMELIAEVEGVAVAAARLKRLFAAEDVVRVQVREQGLVGVLYHPAGSGPSPAIIILSGSDGRIRERQAALLASHGFAALTLAYFNAEGLPKNLVHIPLEYFETAIHWLQAQSVVDGDKIGVIGLSRGGELALLLGATFPAIKAVVACSPSGLVQAGVDGNNYSRSAWTHHGKPLQQAVVKITPLLWLKLIWQSIRVRAFPMRDMFLTTLKDRKHLNEATIAVENVQGPILLISSEDDQMWPATIFSHLVMKRLAEYHHLYPDQHLSYKDAGHFVSFPYNYPFLPPLVKRIMGLALGGTVEGAAASSADSWPRILAFFAENLGVRF
ncbi:MAG TPA: acyl-CoA thioesterase/bile acid-CoA:amino acid N-acyltransferase family protein [Ktedonobacteraceae bacterium]|nr:acyl-CoA thioesterase/bile acid-CoA:amino acid N-acyltransferase family protein [Ktedonobacteraceae bacterium]